MTARITYVASGDHPDDPMWEFSHELWILPHNARMFGEMVTAPRWRYVLAAAAEADASRLRQALAFYADFHENPNDGPWGVSSEDFGRVARAALTAAKEQLK